MALAGVIVDCSSYNSDPTTWDLTAAKAAGLLAIFVKATQGTSYTNPYFSSAVTVAKAAGVPIVAYHFADFTNPQAEAAYFLSVAGPLARILDSETNVDLTWQEAFLAALNEPQDLLLDYGSASTLPTGNTRALLWPAAYGQSDPALSGEVAWQCTDTGTVAGMSGQFDLSTWTGSQESFNVFFQVAGPSPGPLPTPEEATVTTDIVIDADGTTHLAWVDGFGTLVHNWRGAGSAVWGSEDVAKIAGEGGPFRTADHFFIYESSGETTEGWPTGGQLVILATDTNGNAWWYAQNNPGSGWGVNALPPAA